MISYLFVVAQHQTKIVIHALLKCQQENLYHDLFLNDTATTEICTLYPHYALPTSRAPLSTPPDKTVSTPPTLTVVLTAVPHRTSTRLQSRHTMSSHATHGFLQITYSKASALANSNSTSEMTTPASATCLKCDSQLD